MTHHTKSGRTVWTLAGMVFAFMAVAASGVFAAPKKKQAAQSAPPPAHYGPFTISNIGQLEYVSTKGSGKTPIKIDGPNLSAKSPRYDIAAPHIRIVLINTGTPARPHARTLNANGGVRIVLRNPEASETTTITCDRADYVATNPAKELGRLNMTGKVHSVRRSPEYGDTPLVQDWTSAYIEFVDENTTKFVGENGNVSGAIREPAPRKKAGQP